MSKDRGNILYSLLNNPKIFNPFSKYFGDQDIVDEVVRNDMGSPGDKKILDVGCGTGNLSRMLPSENYVGIDSDEKYIKFARENFKRKFIVMNAAQLEFDSGTFDIVFSKDIFHHLECTLFIKVLSEMERVLKPDGKAVIVEISYRLSDDMFYKKALRSLDRGKHIREYSVLKEAISSSFNIEKSYIKKGAWGDLAVFLAVKRSTKSYL